MVFSSIPSYLDPPNWQQQSNHQNQANGSESSPQYLAVPPPHGAGSTVDQAQLAKIQAATPDQAAAALKCPRCESTNTKFCYFNNYSLSQPRHFCKTCRRYWTRGGALRNVPVGGGCRRNHKKNKKSSTSNTTTTTRSKSPISNNNDKEKEYSPVPLSGVIATSSTIPRDEQIGQFLNHRPYMMTNSLQNLSLGLNNLREIQAQSQTTGHMGFQFGGGGGVDQWRFQQFPNFFNGFDQSSTPSASVVSYPFQSDVVEAPSAGLVGAGGDVAAANYSRVAALTHQLPSVKFEYNGGLNLLPRSPLSFSENNNNHYNSWTTHDLSALASSSATAHHLL